MESEAQLDIELDGLQTAYQPGEAVEGTVSWDFRQTAPREVELRLIWYTRGKGTEDSALVDSVRFDSCASREQRRFRMALPEGPYSFSGRLISLIWALEAVAQPGDACYRQEITISPAGQEVLLGGTGS